jgi:hypothetical protein
LFVLQGKHRTTGQEAALKIITVESEEELKDFQVEIDILKEADNEGIVKLYEAYYHKDNLWLCIELCPGGALDSIYTDLEQPLSEQQIRVTTHYMLKALHYLHGFHVIHRDMKAGNILLMKDGSLKLADFGVSAYSKDRTDDKRNTFIGTPYWMAPEVIICETVRDKPYDGRCDVWSLGITLIELAQMNPPHHDMHPMRVLFKIPKADPPELEDPDRWSPMFRDFIEKCLTKDPASRPTALEALEHPFCKDQSDLSCMRDLYQLYRAPVKETIEDVADDVEGAVKAEMASQVVRKESLVASAAPAVAVEVTSAAVVPAETTPPPADETPQQKEEREAIAALDQANASSSPAAPAEAKEETPANGKRFATLTRTRTYMSDDGIEVTVTISKVVDREDIEKNKRIRDLVQAQLREHKAEQRKEKANYDALMRKQNAEVEAIEKTQTKDTEVRSKAAASALDVTDKTQRKEMDKFMQTQDKELKAFIKDQKAAAAKAHKALKADQKAAMSAAKSKDEKQSLKDKQAADEKEFLNEQERTQSKDLGVFEMNQRVARVEFDLKQLKERRGVDEGQLSETCDLEVAQLSEMQSTVQTHTAAISTLQVSQMQVRHERERTQSSALKMRKEQELIKSHARERKNLPLRQKSQAKERQKEFKSQKSTQSDTMKLRIKQRRAQLDNETFKSEKKQTQEEYQKTLRDMEEQFEKTEQLRQEKELEHFNTTLEDAMKEFNEYEEKEYKDLIQLHDEKEKDLNSQTEKQLRELNEAHQRSGKALTEDIEHRKMTLKRQYDEEEELMQKRLEDAKAGKLVD